MCETRRSYRSHEGKHDIDPADHTDHTGKQKIIYISQIIQIPPRKTQMCVQNIDPSDPTLARARSCRVHPGKCIRVCKSELYMVQLTQGNTYMCSKNNSRSYRLQDARAISVLPAAEIIFGRRATRAAAPDIFHA